MIVGYVLIGAIVGLLASVVALGLGASFLLALGVYSLAGTVAMILLAGGQLCARAVKDRLKAAGASAHDALPDRPSLDPAAPRTEDAVSRTSLRILAVDDDPFILKLIPIISAKEGFSEVTAATSGAKALKLLRKPETTFDCILLDIDMPGMDGIELCRRIRQMPRYRQTPIIMLTAMRDMTNMGEAYRAGATDYATKPFDIDELGAHLRRARDAVALQPESTPGTQDDTGHDGVNSLVEHAVLSNFLTQLPRKELSGIQVFAVRINRTDTLHPQLSPRSLAALLQDVAAACADCLGTDRLVMAYADDATLLLAVTSAPPLVALNIEIAIEELLQSGNSACATSNTAPPSLAVGGPVQPQGPKAERAGVVISRAIALAENRVLDKQGGLYCRIG